MFIYPRWEIDAAHVAPYAFPLAALAAVLALGLLRGRLGRGPLTAALFFGGTLLPALGYFDVYPMQFSFVADHFQYLASLGPLALLAAVLTLAAQRGLPLRPVGGALLLALGALTWNRAGDYADAETLWRATLKDNPAAWIAHNNLGAIRLREGRHGEAAGHLEDALRHKPDYAGALYNLGDALAALGRPDEAVARYRDALRVDPEFARAHNNLGNALQARGELAQAAHHFTEAARLTPGHAEAHYNLGSVREALGEHRAAAEAFERAVRLRPGDPILANRLAWLRATSPDASVRDGQRAVQLARVAVEALGQRSTIPLETLAAAHAAAGEFDEAQRVQALAVERTEGPRRQDAQRRLAEYRAGRALQR